MKYWSGDVITKLQPEHILVFGANPEGRHGAGLAKTAMAFGARYGIGRGLKGQTYALVTKNLSAGFMEASTGIMYDDAGFKSVSYDMIQDNIIELYECCLANPDKWFIIPYKKSDRNLNGYSGLDMFAMFTGIEPLPRNIVFHNSFKGS